MYYTNEDINKAKNVDLVNFAKNQGLNLKKEKDSYRVLDISGSLYIFTKNNENTQGFYWHKYNIKGNAIDFCKLIFKDDYLGAIERLLNNNNTSILNNSKESNLLSDLTDKPLEKSTFLLPDRDDNINKAYSYLINLIRSM